MCYYNYYDSFCTVKAKTLNEFKYSIINESTIVLHDLDDIHIFRLMEDKWFCDSCSKLCKLNKHIEKIFFGGEPNIVNKLQPKIKFETVSSASLPFSFNIKQSQIYEKQISDGLNLSYELFSYELAQILYLMNLDIN